MIRILIIDDEIDAIEALRMMLEEFCENVEIIGTSQSPLEGIKMINQLKPDLLLLDIEMPGGNGFDVLEATSLLNYKVIFTTAYNHYAIRAIKYGALDYLMKPIDIDELQSAVDLAKEQLDGMIDHQIARNEFLEHVKQPDVLNERIAICVKEGYAFIDHAEIIYLQSEGSYTRFFTLNQEYIVSKNLKTYEELLPSDGFLRVSNSHLVNIQNIRNYLREDGGILMMTNGNKITISRARKNLLKEKLGI